MLQAFLFRLSADAPDGDATSAWNQDGVILFTSGPLLYSVPAAGGLKPTPVTSLDTSRNEISHRWVQFLPDGRHFPIHRFRE